jgi:hypothetical protein
MHKPPTGCNMWIQLAAFIPELFVGQIHDL